MLLILNNLFNVKIVYVRILFLCWMSNPKVAVLESKVDRFFIETDLKFAK